MKKEIIQECINKNCKSVFFVPYYQIGVPKVCEKCINKTNKQFKQIKK